MNEYHVQLASILDTIKRRTVEELIKVCGYILVVFVVEDVELSPQARSKIAENGTLGIHVGYDLIPNLVLDETGFRGDFSFDQVMSQLSVPWSYVMALAIPVGRPPNAHLPVATFAPYNTPPVAPKPKEKPNLKLV